MPATEYQGSFLSRISIRRNQVVSMDGNHEQELEELEIFQKNISERFSDLISDDSSSSSNSASSSEPFLSIAWVRKLLDVFLCCEAEFKAVLIMGRDPSLISKPPLDRLIPELFDRAVKALDICNAVMHGIDSVRQCQKLAEIAAASLEQRPLGEGQARRAKKALAGLLSAMGIDETSGGHKSAERSWSFGRRGGGGGGVSVTKDRGSGQSRASTWGVPKNWSAAKQIQVMSANLVAPRGAEASGLAMPVYIMSIVTVFVMWALVAAIPCQEKTGLATHFQVPRQLGWAQSMVWLHEKIGEELKKKEKKGASPVGLLEEIQKMEKLGQSLLEFSDGFQYPVPEEKLDEAAAQVADLTETCRRMEDGLVPLQHQIREVFHRIVRSRTEVLDVLDHAGKSSAPSV
ncbi:hypothetical protein SAY86_028270 [Trapa natans]|uniref:Protein BYPASS-related n=1 Tax=Trapa natans TaxID=22666 RepID=A0AAN7M1Z1_TRANT|nr:hypothetical protein SAY86_028270 [Trapa natans]